MQTPQQMKENMAKQADLGLSFATCRQVQELIHQVAKEKIDAAIQDILKDLGFEASKIDVLAHQMLQIHRMNSIGDSMARRLKEDDLPASFYNAYRHVVKDTSTMLLTLDEQRIKENRKTFVSPEDEQAKLAEAQRWNHVQFAMSEREFQKGYFYEPRYGVVQPALDLKAEQVIERDIIRMRLLPKSPREDAIIADALLELEKEEAENKAWYEKVNNIEVPSGVREFDPNAYEESLEHINPRHNGYHSTAKRIYLERLQHYNSIWQKAEEKVEGLLEAVGIKIGFRHESVGLPKCVQKAAEGDADAISELKSAVAEMQANQSKKKSEAEKKEQLERALSTPFHVQAMAIFLAFSSLWTCTTMVFGQPINTFSHRLFKPVAGSCDGESANPVSSDNTLSPLDAVKIGILTHTRMTCGERLQICPGWRHGLPVAGDSHEIPDLFRHFFSRDPADDLKSRELNGGFSRLFSSVSTDSS